MAQTKKQKNQAEQVKQLQPKKEAVDAKELTNLKWNPDLFDREITYKDEKGNYHTAPANWRKFNVNKVDIIAIEGDKVTKKEEAAFEASFSKLSKEEATEARKKYFIKEAKKKAKEVTE